MKARILLILAALTMTGAALADGGTVRPMSGNPCLFGC